MEPRTVTRWDVHEYARRAYEMGVRYIGGCCGVQPYHIRAIAEEVGLMMNSESLKKFFDKTGRDRLPTTFLKFDKRTRLKNRVRVELFQTRGMQATSCPVRVRVISPSFY